MSYPLVPVNPRLAREEPGAMHGPQPLLGPDGMALPPREKLVEDIAYPQLVGPRAFWDETVASGLTPGSVAALLRQCVRGDIRAYLTLAEEIEERDLHYCGVLGVRKRAIAGVRASVDEDSAKATDKKIAEFVRQLIGEPIFVDLVEDLMDGVSKGFSVCEIQWGERDGRFSPLAYHWRDPKYFTFDHISRTQLRLSEFGTIDGRELAPAKFICHAPRLKTGIPIRAGLARTAIWGFLFKSFSVKNWAAFLDVYGMPLRVGKYHPNATAVERRTLLNAVARIASDAAAIIPESMLIEFIEAKQSGMPSYENMCRYWDEQMSKVVIGQTMTTDNGSSRAQAQVHNEVRMDIVEWDGRQLARTLNRDLIAWSVALNFGQNARAPRVEFPAPKREDVRVKASALAQLVPLGLEVSQDDVREMVGMPAPKEGAKLLAPQQKLQQTKGEARDKRAQNAWRLHGGACGCGACRPIALNRAAPDGAIARPAPIDMADAIGLDESDDWEPLIAPILDQILQAADASGDYEAFGAHLSALFGTLDVSKLQERLMTAQLQARGLGLATDAIDIDDG